VYITRVLDIKESAGTKFIIVDGGLNHMLRPALLRITHPTFVANKLGHPVTERCTIGGPICNMIDILARDVELPEVEVGDLIGIGNAGAYCRSMSPEGFLCRPGAAEWLVTGGAAHLARPAGNDEDTLRGQESLLDGLDPQD
jgi:diaminopimelate decarboxylase